MTRAELYHAAKRFKIGHPFHMLQPEFVIPSDITTHDDDVQQIVLRVQMPERDTGFMTPVHCSETISKYADERELFHTMRRMLHMLLSHEADESIQIDGVRVFDPHAPGHPLARL